MLISVRHKLVVFAMPKTASNSIAEAIDPYCDIVFRRRPRIRHMPVRKYRRMIQPLIASFGCRDPETACLFREPVSWLGSWYSYRTRGDIPQAERSTQNMTFDDFVLAYLDRNPPEFARVGQQSKFVAAEDGSIGIDHLYRYEDMAEFLAFLGRRLGAEISIGHLNASPRADLSLAPATRRMLETELARDFEIHASIDRSGSITPFQSAL
ncbi:MAG: gamma-glutamyl kinase [Paracoccaceae bacterium]